MVLLGDNAQVEARSVRFEIVLFLIQLAWKSFWMHPTELQGDVGHVESRFSLFGDSVSFGAR
jgi:hypothetical protein